MGIKVLPGGKTRNNLEGGGPQIRAAPATEQAAQRERVKTEPHSELTTSPDNARGKSSTGEANSRSIRDEGCKVESALHSTVPDDNNAQTAEALVDASTARGYSALRGIEVTEGLTEQEVMDVR